MSKQQEKVVRYSSCFKRKVVEEVAGGSSISAVRRRYGIGGCNTVQQWLKRYGREDLLTEIVYVKMRSETDRIKELEQENRRLKLALADAVLAQEALESLVAVANEHYQTDLKKSLGTRPSAGARPQKGRR